jgi:hypothetical protein
MLPQLWTLHLTLRTSINPAKKRFCGISVKQKKEKVSIDITLKRKKVSNFGIGYQKTPPQQRGKERSSEPHRRAMARPQKSERLLR